MRSSAIFLQQFSELLQLQHDGRIVNQKSQITNGMTSGRFDTASERFVRISRPAIVNIESVKELDPMFHGEYMVTLRNGTRVTLTRSYREQLRQLGVMTQAGWS
jgi:DNA-binding LytR/AlgR family response regulator